MSQNIINKKETNDIKIRNFFQALDTADDIKDTLNEISDTTTHPKVNEKVTVNTIAGQSEKKKKRKTTVVLGDSIVKRIQGRKLGRKVKQNVIVKSFPGAKLDCMSHLAIPTVKSNPIASLYTVEQTILRWMSLERQLMKRLLSWQKALNQPQMRY